MSKMTKLFQLRPLLLRGFVFILLPGACLTLILFVYLSASLEIKHDRLLLEGLNKEVSIDYDQQGVPYIKAEDDMAVFYGMGFVHAQNRLWQMEMNRRTASGRLSEVLGDVSLASDKLMRVLGLVHNAEKMWQLLPEKEKQILTHYVKGVNAGIAKLSTLPPEFLVYRYQPEAWTEVDSLLWMQLLSFQLSTDMGADLRRAMLLQTYGVDKTKALMPVSLNSESTSSAEQKLLKDFAEVIPQIDQSAKKFVGSNSWVLSGQHTKSGSPLLANDPHLNHTLPAIFYLAKLKGDRLDVSGASFPGLPFIAIGQNHKIAWGITNLMADTQDIFIERINPKNINQYEVDGEYLDMQIQTEEIMVKPDLLKPEIPGVKFQVRRSIHGPLISDLISNNSNISYSLRWTGDDQNGGTFSSFLALNYAQNWQEFKQALSSFVAPVHNFVYADVDGNIGRLAPGFIPNRKIHSGAIPRTGWLSENNWQDWIPYQQLPSEFNPDSGIIVAANNDILAPDYPYWISDDWAPGHRAARITELLKKQIIETNNKVNSENFVTIQQDDLLPSAPLFMAYIKKLNVNESKYDEIFSLFENWDARMTAESPQAAIYAAWMAHLVRLLIEDDLKVAPPHYAVRSVLGQMQFEVNQRLIENILFHNNYQWCDYVLTDKVETCRDIALIALDHAVDELTTSLGNTPEDWSWHELHKAHFPHFPMSDPKYLVRSSATNSSPLAFLFHRSIDSAGSGYTVNVAPISYDKERRFEQLVGPVYRQVIDLQDRNKSLFSLATGQSGNPLSPHYDDLILGHQQGNYFTLTEQASTNPLVLAPITPSIASKK